MSQLAMPARHEWLTQDRKYGKIASSVEPGFALTVGNATGGAAVLDPRASPRGPRRGGAPRVLVSCRASPRTAGHHHDLRKGLFRVHGNGQDSRLKARSPDHHRRRFDPTTRGSSEPEVGIATLDKAGLGMELRGASRAIRRRSGASGSLPITQFLDAASRPSAVNFQVRMWRGARSGGHGR